jgi:hypothetical protein
MATATRKKKSSKPTAKTCLHCKQPRRSRGLCQKHLDQARYVVRSGKATWKELERAGKALARGEQRENPFKS